MKKLTLTARISRTDLMKVSLLLSYRSAVFIVITAVMLVLLAVNLFLVFRSGLKSMDSFAPLVILIVLPASVVFSARKRYRKNPEYRKPVVYTFDEESLHVATAKKESRFDLSALFKVRKMNNWLLVYRTTRMANVIPLRDISSGQLQQLKEILEEANVRNNL